MKRIIPLIISMLIIASLAQSYEINEWSRTVSYRSIIVAAPAVGEGKNGYFGVITHINVTMMNGSGNVYFAASPLTQIDMQGSAKLAVDVACALAGIDKSKYDFLFYVSSDSPIVGGPSAGATMAVATLALLEDISLNDSVAMTGMINPDGSIGPVGGILEKGEAVAKAGKKLFLIPKGQMIEYVTNYTRHGWIVIGKPEAINVSEVLYKKYGLVVKEVEDINEAFYYFTGYKFPEEKSSKPITTYDYRNIMKPLANRIIREANESYVAAKQVFSNANIPTGGFFSLNPKGYIWNRLDDSKNDLKNAIVATNNAFFYYGISKAFQSMINSRFVSYACRFYENDDATTIFENVSKAVNSSYEFAKKSQIDGLISLQCVGAAQTRAIDAMALLNESRREWKSFMKYKGTMYEDDSKALEALYDLAYAMERSKTVYWWANLSKEFNETNTINESGVKVIASRYYDYAKQIYAYAQTLVQETGSNSKFVSNAKDLLDKAGEEMDVFPAASLFNSLESIANSNIAIEAIGGLTEDKLNRTMQMASYAIIRARNESIEPILAVSYYEFGRSIESKSDALIYYKYAYMIANMLRLSKGIKITKPEYVGNENNGSNGNSNNSNSSTPGFEIIVATMAIAIAILWKKRKTYNE